MAAGNERRVKVNPFVHFYLPLFSDFKKSDFQSIVTVSEVPKEFRNASIITLD